MTNRPDSVLKKMLYEIVDDSDIYKLLCVIIDSFEISPGTGLPMGNQTSQLFALYYLNDLDRLCKERLRIKYYVRYMDDIIIVDKDKQLLCAFLGVMEQYVNERLKLEFNDKTQIFPIK